MRMIWYATGFLVISMVSFGVANSVDESSIAGQVAKGGFWVFLIAFFIALAASAPEEN